MRLRRCWSRTTARYVACCPFLPCGVTCTTVLVCFVFIVYMRFVRIYSIPLQTEQMSMFDVKSSSLTTSMTRTASVEAVNVSRHSQPHSRLCPDLGRNLKVLIMVTSAPHHTIMRNAIRNTWGHYALRTDVAIAFMVDRVNRAADLAAIASETSLYEDIIVARYKSRSRLHLKTLALLQWANTYCSLAPFILKTDDNMFINVPKLLSFLSDPERHAANRSIWGRVHSNPRYIAQTNTYYLSSDSYVSDVIFPDYVASPAYILSRDAIRPLLDIAVFEPYVPLEDVFATSILADKAGIARKHTDMIYKINANTPCIANKVIGVYRVGYRWQYRLWLEVLDNSTCKIAADTDIINQ